MLKKLISTTFLIIALLLNTVPAYAQETLPFLPFSDVKSSDWFYDAVSYAYEHKMFSGTSKTTFSPKQYMTRAMFVTVLANMTDADINDYTRRHFLDVDSTSWYAKQVEWAASNNLTSGTDTFTFSPNSNITREQAVTFLYRYAALTNNDTSTFSTTFYFKDYDRISSYAKTAMDWAISNKIVSGTPDRYLNPKSFATRAEMAQIFKNVDRLLTNRTISPQTSSLPVPDEMDETMYHMSLEELVGQVFQPRYPDSDQADITRRYQPAGYTFYEKDFRNKTKDEVKAMIRNVQAQSRIPLFIAVDEEGGTVNRVSTNSKLYPAPFDSIQDVYAKSGLEGIRQDTVDKATLLTSLGVNMNLAPVCDLSTNPDDYIYDRTTGQDAETTSEIIAAIVSTMDDNGLFSALKHFPGYGNNKNTHTGISIDDRPLSQFEREDLLPFISGIENNATCVLVSHNIVNCLDSERPASISKTVIDMLRDDLGFQGVVMTDDLSMDAIKLYTNGKSPVTTAFQAGSDLLLTSDFERDYSTLLNAVRNGTITKAKLKESVKRILTIKLR